MHELMAKTIDGQQRDLKEFKGKTLLVVNVASKCGFTSQYAGLEKLHDTYSARGFAVLGFPCNQFGGQEPGSDDEIKEFCSLKFDVSFPMFAKVEVNGVNQHPLFATLNETADARGVAGDVKWNFEKFLVSPEGQPVARFRTQTEPEAPEVIEAIEANLPG